MQKPLSHSLFLILLFSYSAGAQTISPDVNSAVTDRAAARFLEQATWGPTPQSISDLKSVGFNGWLQSQFSLNTSDIPDQPLLNSDGKTNTNLAPVQAAFFVNNVTGQDQLRQRVAFALSEIWVVSTEAVNNAYAYPPYWRVLRDNAFGNYRDLITAMTLNPAMGRYLSMANNNKATKPNTSANENYARELMQLFTIGLTQLNMDGSPVLDSKGTPVPTYTQAMVTSTAKALTGWTYPVTPGTTAKTNNPAYYIGQMYAVESEHDNSSKTVVGNVTIPSGQSAERDLNSLLDAIMAQPTMAPFISKQLIQHLVTSNPSPDYIKRVVTIFNNNGAGVKGDLKAVISAILLDPEARAGDDPTSVTNADFGHLREPILLASHLLRGLGAMPTATNTASGVASALGQSLFNQGSVFSYFSPSYEPGVVSPATKLPLLGPEFEIYTTQTASTTADYIYNVTFGGSLGGTKVNLAQFMQYSTNLSGLLNEIDLVFTHSSMSSTLRDQAMKAAEAATSPTRAVYAALYIVLTSAEYSVIH